MLPLFDMLAQAQNGQGMELLARQFNLSQQQAQLAVEALLPAFSQGLKRNTADPYGLGTFMSAMAGDMPNFEEASRALFANDAARFRELSEAWPVDVRDYARQLAYK